MDSAEFNFMPMTSGEQGAIISAKRLKLAEQIATSKIHQEV